jgi:hypothetical protein
VVAGNLCTDPTRTLIPAFTPTFYIVIDDGAHTTPGIIQAFLMPFPLLQPGGLFVAEDVHAVYRQGAGGVLAQASAQAFFKGVAELTNIEPWEAERHPQTSMSTFFASRQPFPTGLADGHVSSVEERRRMGLASGKSP